jgi:heparan-alpha-glucosaminide N-acetyltransferase
MAATQILTSDKTAPVAAEPDRTFRPKPARVVSIDIVKGLEMQVMIFVNQLGEMKRLPWWTYHMPSTPNGMTNVDVVFPFFLFIVGMSIPLSNSSRNTRSWRTILTLIPSTTPLRLQ